MGEWKAPVFGRTFRPSRVGFCPLRYLIPTHTHTRQGRLWASSLSDHLDTFLRDVLGFAAKLAPTVLKSSGLLSQHYCSYKYRMPLTVAFSPDWTGSAGFLGGGRQRTTVPPSKGVISTLTVENMHLANCQRQYLFVSLISSTDIQGGSETNFLNYII